MRIAVPRDVGPLNIFVPSTPEPLAELIYDKLVAPSPYVAQPQPWLATAVRQVDPSTWDVDLRSDVTWHDGLPFTADDVIFTFSYMKAAPTGRWTHHVSDVPTVDSVTAVAANTVRLHCAYACPELGTVTLADLPILPKHVWSAVPPDKAKQVSTRPVGTGPYRLVDYSPTAGYRFEANPGYFAGVPRVRELVMPVIVDPSPRSPRCAPGRSTRRCGRCLPSSSASSAARIRSAWSRPRRCSSLSCGSTSSTPRSASRTSGGR